MDMTTKWLKRLTTDGRKLRGREIRALRGRIRAWQAPLAWNLMLSPKELQEIEKGRRPFPSAVERLFRRWAVLRLTEGNPWQDDWIDKLNGLKLQPVWRAPTTEQEIEAQFWVDRAQC